MRTIRVFNDNFVVGRRNCEGRCIQQLRKNRPKFKTVGTVLKVDIVFVTHLRAMRSSGDRRVVRRVSNSNMCLRRDGRSLTKDIQLVG